MRRAILAVLMFLLCTSAFAETYSSDEIKYNLLTYVPLELTEYQDVVWAEGNRVFEKFKDHPAWPKSPSPESALEFVTNTKLPLTDWEKEFIIGYANASLNQRDESTKRFNAAVQKKPDYFAAWCAIILAQPLDGREEKMAKILERAIKANPDKPEYYIELSRLSLIANPNINVVVELEKAIKKLKSVPDELYYNQAAIISLLPDNELTALLPSMQRNAEELLKRKKSPMHYALNGTCQYLMGNFAKSLGFYEKALEEVPEFALALLGAANSAKNLNNAEKTKTYAKRLLPLLDASPESDQIMEGFRKYLE